MSISKSNVILLWQEELEQVKNVSELNELQERVINTFAAFSLPTEFMEKFIIKNIELHGMKKCESNDCYMQIGRKQRFCNYHAKIHETRI